MKLLDYEKLKVNIGSSKEARVFTILYYTIKNEKIELLSAGEKIKYEKYLEELNIKEKNIDVHMKLEESSNNFILFIYYDFSIKDLDMIKNNAIKAGAAAYRKISNFDFIQIEIDTNYLVYETILGFIMSSYNYNFLKKCDNKKVKKIYINTTNENALKAVMIGNAQNLARFMGDTPANLMNPTIFSKYACDFLKNLENVDINVHDLEYLKAKKMNLILSVAQGSAQPPVFFHATYKGRVGSAKTDIALVGKGVTFDSGGISLKHSLNMSDMKGDMLGGAAVLAAFKAVCERKLSLNVDLFIPLVENLPSGTATKPGDVFISMSGKSVEIYNTDAEGRLILADALTCAQLYKPKYVIDVATLTGSIRVALGDAFIGYFCNDDELSKVINECGLESGDLVWRMPLSNLYLSKLKSHVADLKNLGTPGGGSATAAAFLKEFVENDVKWAHFDIAGVMNENTNSIAFGSGMTGKSVGTLIMLLEKISKNG